jgi:4-amino-4-deoxy-L-arabinose transferase-like glycosyltransferase
VNDRPAKHSRSGSTNPPGVASRFEILTSPTVIALILFLVALVPRLIGLDRFLTSDENTNIFIAGSDVIAAFLRGDLRGTYWHFYPGVTMSWLDAVGMGGTYLLDAMAKGSLPPFTEYIYGDILSLIVANRLPYAVLSAAAVPALFLLARKLVPLQVALLGALFLAFDPFYLAHSRVAHGDAPVAVFMSFSALTFFIFTQEATPRVEQFSNGHPSFLRMLAQSLTAPYLVASAVLGSLAALTKAPGQFMALFIVGMSLLYAIVQLRRASFKRSAMPIASTGPAIPVFWLTVVAGWGLVSLFVFVLLWPAMWVDPLGTFGQMWQETFGKVDEGHLVYFLGQPTLDPGLWFYTYVIPFRLTPVILIGLVLSLLLFVPGLNSLPPLKRLSVSGRTLDGNSAKVDPPLIPTYLLLWLFTITLFIFGHLSPKKQDRYLLPLFPFLNLLAAIGWVGLIDLTYYAISRRFRVVTSASQAGQTKAAAPPGPYLSGPIASLSLLVLLAFQLAPVLTYYPYYLTYFNPLMGGPRQAVQTTLMGWGEGMEQVAAYLNSKPDAKNLYVASTPSQTLLPYFVGTGENFYTNDIALRADYVVLYLAQMQRLAPSPEIVHYFEAQQPEQTITIKDVTYAKIYAGPKFIRAGIPPEAVPANVGLNHLLRLAGYHRSEFQDRARTSAEMTNLDLTLYWHALAPIVTNYTVSVRARDAAGTILAQQDQWPVDGLLPTSQWRQGDYVADTHRLEMPMADLSGITTLEVVVYDAENGETLGPPITIGVE